MRIIRVFIFGRLTNCLAYTTLNSNLQIEEQSSYSAMLHIPESVPPPESTPAIPESSHTWIEAIPESILPTPGIPEPDRTPIPFDSGIPRNSRNSSISGIPESAEIPGNS